MKSKEIQEKSKKGRLKLKGSFIAFTMLALIVFFVAVPVFADSAIRVENCNKCEEYSQKLGEEINHFIELDTEPNKIVSTQVTAAINEYRKELFNLQTHDDVENRSLLGEITLAYTKGNAAGRLAWIYYYNIYAFTSEEPTAKIAAEYDKMKASVKSATQHSVLSAQAEVMCDDLNRLIYTERAKCLSLPNDSMTSSALIAGVTEDFKSLSSPDIFGEKYREKYEDLVSDLALQRVRDALTTEMEHVFSAIRPSESFSSSPNISLFIYELKSAKTIRSMNESALACIKDLLALEEKKIYSYKAKQSYLSLVQTAVGRATEVGTSAKLADIFSDYSLSLKKAEVKDSIYILLLGDGSTNDNTLIALEAKYNADGGRIDLCESYEATDTELTNAKADLFLYEHDVIVKKEFDALTQEDASLAQNAIVHYCELEHNVKRILLPQINIIAEKYNYILVLKISSILPNDALYLDLSESIANEIKSTSRESIEEFYNKVSRIPEKANALARVIQEYREILSGEAYKNYTESEIKELNSVLETLSQELEKINPADTAIYYDDVEDARNRAIQKLNAINQCARVRIEARGSNNPKIKEELDSATEKIKAQSSKSEMILQANRAIYKIQRLLTSDEISSLIEEEKKAIEEAQFLTESEKKSFTSSLNALSSFSDKAKDAENITALEGIWKAFYESFNKIEAEAGAIDLSRAISAYAEKISESISSAQNHLDSLEYISKENYDEIYNKLQSLQSEAKAKNLLCKSTAAVIANYEESLKSQESILKSAEAYELDGYKISVLSIFTDYESIKGNYSVENYNKILAIKEKAEAEIKGLTTKSECDTFIKNIKSEIEAINDLLDDEKASALLSLLEILTNLKSEAPLYSSDNFAKIEGLYEEGKIEINNITDIKRISDVNTALAKYSLLISEVRKDRLYTSKDAYSISTPSLRYPSDYNYSNGLHGSIALKNGLVSDAKFSIALSEQTDFSEISKAIKRAAKEGTLITYESIPNETLKLLQSSSAIAELDVSLSKIADGASGYTLKMLLPNDMLGENILGLAFLNGDEVEFYPTERIDSLIGVNLQHFSKYYVVAESTVNLKPLLIALIILLIGEFAVLATMLYFRYRRKNEPSDQADNDLPTLPMSAVLPFCPALTRIYPKNGVTLAVLLMIAAVALGITVALLAKKEIKAKQLSEHKELQKRLKGKKDQLLLGSGDRPVSKEDEFFVDDELIQHRSEENPKVTVGASHKAEIDLDLIASNFESDETVTLQALKSKGLVGEQSNYLRILAKGSLTKPLKIEANEFTNAAKEVLKLSGGEAKKID